MTQSLWANKHMLTFKSATLIGHKHYLPAHYPYKARVVSKESLTTFLDKRNSYPLSEL